MRVANKANCVSRSLALLLLLNPLFFGSKPSFAQEFGITQATFESPNRIVIQYNAQTGVSYILLRGDSVTNISIAVATNSGPAGLAQFIQTIPLASRESYFRIRQN